MRGMRTAAERDPTLIVKSRTTGQVALRVLGYLRPYPRLATATIGCAVLAQASSFAYPKLTQMVIDDVIDAGRPEMLLPVVGGLLAAFFFRDGFNSLRIRLNNSFEQGVIYDIRREVFGKLQRLPTAWFDRRTSGDVVTRVLEDVNAMERLLIDGTEQGVVSVLGLVGVGVILFLTHPMLAAVALIPVPFLIGGALWYTLTAHRRYRARSRASAELNAMLMDNLQGIRQVKSFGREAHESERFAEKANALRRGTLDVMRAWAWYQPAMAFLAALGTVLVVWLGGQEVLAERLTKGELVGFLLFLAMFYQPVAQLHGLNQMAQAARASGERVFDILDAQEEPVLGSAGEVGALISIEGLRSNKNGELLQSASENELGSSLDNKCGEVRYEEVSSGYEGRDVLHNVSFRAAPGETVALVGPTGAGKTTLVNLLPRFYELRAGQIFVNGVDTRSMPLDELRSKIAIVTQEPFLFNDTIRENIRFGRLDASDEELDAAAAAAHCTEFISRLPEGMETRVGERGVRLSVGEKQRVSIARALLRNAPILILDEATASVDTATERWIQGALEKLMEGRTCLVIAHRLGTIVRAHRILVLQSGRIVESGRHDGLLEKGGLYARLWQAQNLAEALEKPMASPSGAGDSQSLVSSERRL